MKTELIEQSTRVPWLEHSPFESAPSGRTELARLPFLIGRGSTADLIIPSQRVSREHARLESSSAGFRLLDLGSTNGVFLNGKRIKEAFLSHGDMFAVADVEFTFHQAQEREDADPCTQVMDGASEAETARARTLLRRVRIVAEQTLCGRACLAWEPVVGLADGKTVGFSWIGVLGTAAETGDSFCNPSCEGLPRRLRRALRFLAAREAQVLPAEVARHVPITACELQPAGLPSLCGLRRFARNAEWVLEVPHSSLIRLPGHDGLREALAAASLKLAVSRFAGGKSQVSELKELRPAWIKIDPSTCPLGDNAGDRHRHLKTLIRACHDLGIEVAATGVADEAQRDAWLNLGCRSAQGACFGLPRPAFDLAQAPLIDPRG